MFQLCSLLWFLATEQPVIHYKSTWSTGCWVSCCVCTLIHPLYPFTVACLCTLAHMNYTGKPRTASQFLRVKLFTKFVCIKQYLVTILICIHTFFPPSCTKRFFFNWEKHPKDMSPFHPNPTLGLICYVTPTAPNFYLPISLMCRNKCIPSYI